MVKNNRVFRCPALSGQGGYDIIGHVHFAFLKVESVHIYNDPTVQSSAE